MSHPGIETISALLAESGLSAATIAEQREALDAMAATSPPPEGVAVEPVTLAGRPGEWLTPEAATGDGVVLYLHGGGYCIGSLGSHRGLGGRLAMAAGCPVVTLDYRLAPEHPFPAAVDDATARLPRPAGHRCRPRADRHRRRLGRWRAHRGHPARPAGRGGTPSGGRRLPVAVGRPDPVVARLPPDRGPRSDGLQDRAST